MDKFVLAITGPTGAGKTSSGQRVAKGFDRCVNIDADNIKHMIVSGFYENADLPAGGGFTEWKLTGDSIGILAANFLKQGYSVIINGYIDPTAWQHIQQHITLTHKVLLLPDINENIARDDGRSSDVAMGAAAVAEHHNMFLADNFYKDFRILDTSNDTVEETVNRLRDVVV